MEPESPFCAGRFRELCSPVSSEDRYLNHPIHNQGRQTRLKFFLGPIRPRMGSDKLDAKKERACIADGPLGSGFPALGRNFKDGPALALAQQALGRPHERYRTIVGIG